MQIEVKDNQATYVIRNAGDALECLTVVESWVDDRALSNDTYRAAANGLDRWLKGLIAQEESNREHHRRVLREVPPQDAHSQGWPGGS